MRTEIDLPKVKIFVENRIIIARYKENVVIEEEDAKLISEKVVEGLQSGVKYGQLSDIRKIKNFTREARDYLGSKAGNYIHFNAILLEGGIQRSLANMFFMFSKPNIETKVFTLEGDALKWLNSKI